MLCKHQAIALPTKDKGFDPIADARNNKQFIRTSLLYAMADGEVSAEDLGMKRVGRCAPVGQTGKEAVQTKNPQFGEEIRCSA